MCEWDPPAVCGRGISCIYIGNRSRRQFLPVASRKENDYNVKEEDS